MKILFLVAPIPKDKVYGKFAKVGASQPPLGLLYLAAAARDEGIGVDFYDASLPGRSQETALGRIRTFQPDLVALSVVTFAAPTTISFLEEVKRLFPQVFTVVGGPHVTAVPLELLRSPGVDFAVVGDGEVALVRLAQALGDPDKIAVIPGVCYKKEDQLTLGPPPSPIRDLDSVPFPAWDLLDKLDQYQPSAINHRLSPSMAIFTSRGCPFNCIFCNSSREAGVRYHSVERVLAEVKHLVDKYGVREILINDDTFTVNKNRVQEICNGLRRMPGRPIWACNIQVSTVTKEMLRTMKDAGCWLVMPGVESGNPGVLRIIRKKLTLEKVRQVCQWAKEVGLWVKPSFILGHPTETLDTINDTIRFAKSLWCHYPSFALMTPFPGTDLWTMAEQYGTVDKTNYEALSPAASEPPFIPHGLTRELLLQKQREAFRSCYFSPAMVMRHIFSINSWMDVKRYMMGISSVLSLSRGEDRPRDKG